MEKPRVCLNMIVKNESAIIERCLASTLEVIDCYVICDTGSSDNTVEIITSFFARHGVPGEIVHTTFKDFSQSRNEALDAARNSAMEFDFILLTDADMELRIDSPNWWNEFTGPAHVIVQRTHAGLEYPNLRVLRKELPCRYVGVTHEYVDLMGSSASAITGLSFIDHAIGSNRADKYERDVRLLKEGLEAEPDNYRYVFYLANTYFDSGRLREAIECYEKRTTMGGYMEEVYISKYRIGRAYLALGEEANFIKQMLDTFDEYPERAETIHAVAQHALGKRQHRLALGFAQMGMQVAKPAYALFVEGDVYDWRLPDIASVALYWLNRPAEALALGFRIIDIVPSDQRERIANNIKFCQDAIAAQVQS
jgi:glycosyltransferase involved in cell wall biosynthesis